MNIDIICPLFNAEKYIEPLYQSIQKQNNIDLHEIKFVLTRSKDNSEAILKRINAQYVEIEPKDFSHSATREMMAKTCKADIICLLYTSDAADEH